MRIEGTPAQNGRTIGRLWGGALRERIAETRRIQKRRRIRDAEIKARVKDFARGLRKVAPHWLDEAAGMAKSAGSPVEELLMLNCLPADFYSRGNDCSTFVAIGAERNLLFKIRDNRNNVQVFCVKSTQGRRRVQVGHDIGNLGYAHFFDSSGLAGANNTGSATNRVSDEPRLNDCHMLRYFAERASRVEDIPTLFDRVAEQDMVGGAGKERGAIFVFADAEKGLVLECVSDARAVTFVNKGIRVVTNHFLIPQAMRWCKEPPNKNTLLRKLRMEQLLSRYRNRPGLQEIFGLSRDRKFVPHALCNDDSAHHWMTVSAQLQVINRRRPRKSINYICCGNTRHSVYLPIPLTMVESFSPLAGGEFYRATDRLYGKHRCDTHFKKGQTAFEQDMDKVSDPMQLCQDAYRLVCKAH